MLGSQRPRSPQSSPSTKNASANTRNSRSALCRQKRRKNSAVAQLPMVRAPSRNSCMSALLVPDQPEQHDRDGDQTDDVPQRPQVDLGGQHDQIHEKQHVVQRQPDEADAAPEQDPGAVPPVGANEQ